MPKAFALFAAGWGLRGCYGAGDGFNLTYEKDDRTPERNYFQNHGAVPGAFYYKRMKNELSEFGMNSELQTETDGLVTRFLGEAINFLGPNFMWRVRDENDATCDALLTYYAIFERHHTSIMGTLGHTRQMDGKLYDDGQLDLLNRLTTTSSNEPTEIKKNLDEITTILNGRKKCNMQRTVEIRESGY